MNCKTNYLSIMSYAFQSEPGFGFSHGDSAGALNNAALREREAVAPEPEIGIVSGPPPPPSVEDTLALRQLHVLQNLYGYTLDRAAGHVDWNRDGLYEPDGGLVRAYANYRPSDACEYTKFNDGRIRGFGVGGSLFGSLISNHGPALIRLGGRIYVFTEANDRLQYASSYFFDCPAAPDPCAFWSGGGERVVDASEGVDAANVLPDLALVVTKGADRRLRSATLDVRGRSPSWSAFTVIPGAGASGAEPSLAALAPCELYLAYRGLEDGLIRLQRWTCASGWLEARIAVDEDGDPLEKTASKASPGIGVAYLRWGDGEATLYGAFPDPDGQVELWGYDPVTLRWTETKLLDEPLGPVVGRPALGWVPTSSGADTPGSPVPDRPRTPRPVPPRQGAHGYVLLHPKGVREVRRSQRTDRTRVLLRELQLPGLRRRPPVRTRPRRQSARRRNPVLRPELRGVVSACVGRNPRLPLHRLR